MHGLIRPQDSERKSNERKGEAIENDELELLLVVFPDEPPKIDAFVVVDSRFLGDVKTKPEITSELGFGVVVFFLNRSRFTTSNG